MLEIENRIKEIYSSAQRKTQMYAEGEFHYTPNNSNNAIGKINVQSLYVKPSGEEVTVPQAEVHIIYSPYEGRNVEFTIDPSNLSTIGIVEEPRISFLAKIIKPRTEANEKDLEFIYSLLTDSHPTNEFANKLSVGEREREELEREMEKANEKKRKETQKEEDAVRIALEILSELTEQHDCLGIVIDDYYPKYDGKHGLLNDYEKANIDTKISFHLLTESGQAVRVISNIQEMLMLASNTIPVIVFMDGSMPECEYTTGLETAKVLKAGLEVAGLPMPHLVGNSNDDYKNTMLKNANPEHYLTSFDYGNDGWSAIEDLIKRSKTS